MNELRLVVDIPSARLHSAEERAAGVAEAVAERADELAHDLHAVMAEASLSGSGVALLDDARRRVHCQRPVGPRGDGDSDGFRPDIRSTHRCRSCSPKGGAVVANRVLSNRFPSALGCVGQ